ncbi:hypothetical protein ACFCWG_18905 [Streptomyces sp. NPDC056390]|uniref:hypothetical protein n=1 Tax=Streptomyces sp. NPDC056390 TaxID=3345806 RepID=UPI0035D72EA9
MTDPVSGLSGRALTQLVNAARAASNPITVVRHGRREDRASVYDRFVQACSQAVATHDREAMAEVWTTLQAINMRADRTVREAAEALFQKVAMIADPGATGTWARWVDDIEMEGAERPDLEQEFGTDLSRDHDVRFLSALDDFITLARLDLLRRWWHSLLPGPVSRWYMRRKHGNQYKGPARPWKQPRVELRLSEDVLARVDDAKRNFFDTRERTLRRLIAKGLEAESE